MLQMVYSFLRNPWWMFFSVVTVVSLECYLIPELIKKAETAGKRRCIRALYIVFLVKAILVISAIKYWTQELYAREDKLFVSEESKVRSPVADGSDAEEQVFNWVEYMILQGSQRVLEESELKGLTSKELYLIRNGMFAFQGRGFHESELLEYYSQFEWYIPTVEPRDFTWDMLNSYQQTNVVAIKRIEERRMGN